ncbi:MAG TPA: MotA/TolQ/ExbB proton channel family protein [Nitrospirota bacterium]|nr:MotA/TolQ/ExbB proton channel family protein [Nitrospirota bacterium]
MQESKKEVFTMPLWITVVQFISRSVLVLLFFLSIWSVATMLRCSRMLNKADGSPKNGGNSPDKTSEWIATGQWGPFREWAEKSDTLHAGTARVILQTESNDPARVDRAVKSYLSLERSRLERGLTTLATLGSNAPFIGLFGTVLGVIQSFGALGAHRTDAADIMVGISEALVATAFGLFVAIPAVVAFNLFARRLRGIIVKSEAMKDLYLSRVQGGC